MTTVHTGFRGRVAVLTIDHPPANIGGARLRRDLLNALTRLQEEDDLSGVVITGANRDFYSGSDLREFDGEIAEPSLPEVLLVLEALHAPVVAALTGMALGGGLELALACDVRLADPTARLGFPETTLGILPGSGGTVRAARLLGVPRAIDLITSARRVGPDEALRIGLVDAVPPADRLLDEAVARALGLTGRTLVRDRAAIAPDPQEVDRALAAIPRRAGDNVRLAADIVRRSAGMDFDSALAEERNLFEALRSGDEARNLRYLFFAKRAAAKGLRASGTARPVRTVGVAGAGTMGTALARTFAAHGYGVIVTDPDENALKRLTDDVAGIRAVPSPSDPAFGSADLVVDAVFEDMGVKQDLLAAWEPHLRDDAVITSNTSYLDLDEMASALSRPERFAGLHFFNPPDRNPLVEVIRTGVTDDATAATLASLVSELGKTGIPAGAGDGFVANRVYADYRLQAEFLVEEGAAPEQVDAALVSLGMAVGPFAVADMSGLDIAWARRRRLAPTRDPQQRYVAVADRLCEAGRLGVKTGAGWYRYRPGVRRGEPDPAVVRVIDQCRAEKGVVPRAVADEEIQDRVLASMLVAAAELVRAGVASRASDVDVAMTEGFAFPRALGGPLRAMANRPRPEVLDALAAVHRSCPVAFAAAAPAARGLLPDAVARVLDHVAP